MSSFPNTELLSGESTIGYTIALLILYGTSITGFTYIFSFLFKKPSTAQLCIIFIVFILGFVLSIIANVLRLIRYFSPDDQRSIDITNLYMSSLRYFFAIFPPFALGEGLNNMTLLEVFSFNELGADKLYDVGDWEITGMALTFMAWETVVYFAIAVGYEYLSEMPLFQCMSKKALTEDPSLRDDGKIPLFSILKPAFK